MNTEAVSTHRAGCLSVRPPWQVTTLAIVELSSRRAQKMRGKHREGLLKEYRTNVRNVRVSFISFLLIKPTIKMSKFLKVR